MGGWWRYNLEARREGGKKARMGGREGGRELGEKGVEVPTLVLRRLLLHFL